MRVTELRMMQLSSRALERARHDVAKTGDAISSGRRVERPSDDPLAWAEGQRAAARTVTLEGQRRALVSSFEDLQATDSALDGMTQALQRMYEIAIQQANGTYSAADRNAAATEVGQLGELVLAAGNARASDGSHLFAGSQTAAAPFTANGTFVGDDAPHTLSIDGTNPEIRLSGQLLTAANGVDVMTLATDLSNALVNGDQAGITTAVTRLRTSLEQVAGVRAEVGSRMVVVETLDRTTEDLALSSEIRRERALDTDLFESASAWTRALSVLEAARSYADRLHDILRKR